MAEDRMAKNGIWEGINRRATAFIDSAHLRPFLPINLFYFDVRVSFSAMALHAIGFVGSVLSIFGFAESHLPSPGAGTVVRVKAGLQQVDADNTGGTITGVDGYDSLNRYLGSSGSEQGYSE